MALTTLSRLKQHMGLTTTGYDARLETLITQASARIESHCSRVFGTATYRRWLDGNGERFLLLPQWPVTALRMVAVESVVAGYFYQSTARLATVRTDESGATLWSVSTAGVESTSSLTWASYPTVALLMAAAPTGWVGVAYTGSGISDYSTYPTVTVKPVNCDALSPNRADIEVAFQPVSVRLSQEMERAIEAEETYVFPCGQQNVFAWWTAGYTLPQDAGDGDDEVEGNLPDGLILAANRICSDLFLQSGKDSGMKSESIGDYSYTRGEIDDAVAQHDAELAPYKRLEA